MSPRKPLESLIQKSPSHWIWLGGVYNNVPYYGRLGRASLQISPEAKFRLCPEPLCVNPAHHSPVHPTRMRPPECRFCGRGMRNRNVSLKEAPGTVTKSNNDPGICCGCVYKDLIPEEPLTERQIEWVRKNVPTDLQGVYFGVQPAR